jgi:hypothetical protein
MATYTPLQSIVLTSTSSSVTFSNIDQRYTDLILITSSTNDTGSTASNIAIQVNGDTGANYSTTNLYGDGSGAASARNTNDVQMYAPWTGGGSNGIITNSIVQFMNYSNTTTYKTVLSRYNNSSAEVVAAVNLWRSTSAINSIVINAGARGYKIGSTFDLYGISPVAANNTQASGGTDIFYDSSYVYHVFKGSGTFTPNRNLTADILVVAGGGGGGGAYLGGGGGAGGVRAFTSQSLTATAYNVTIGAGGTGGTANSQTKGGNGSTTTFNSTSVSGGGGGGSYGAAINGNSGGSGGGGSGDQASSGGAGNAGSYSPVEGFAGGGSNSAAPNYGAGGGGGASAVGVAGTSTDGGTGGAGTDTYNSINFSTWLTATGMGSSTKVAGGGGGATGGGAATQGAGGTGGGGAGGNLTTNGQGVAGLTNSGSGGGGSERGGGLKPGGAGGSGLVIVRYAR